MAANTRPIFIRTPNSSATTFTSGDTTAKKDLFTSASEGSMIRALSLVSDDTAIINFDLWLQVSGTDYAIGTIQIAAGSGTTAASNATNGFSTTAIKAILSPDGSLMIPTGWKLRGSCKATMTAAKTLYVYVQGGDY